MTYVAKEAGYKCIFVPQADAPEATLVEGIDVYPLESLGRLVTHFRDYHPIEPYRTSIDLDADPPAYAADFQDIKGRLQHEFNSLGFTVMRSWAEGK